MKKLLFVVVLVVSSLAFAEPKKGDKNYFPNCKAMNKVYPNGVRKGHVAYRSALDRDKDGWACERN